MNYIIDDVDKKILMYLIDNTRMPFTEIAKKMNVSAGTIHVRVKKLEEAGIIKGTTLITDYDKMGYQFVAYVGLLLTKTNKTQKLSTSCTKYQMLRLYTWFRVNITSSAKLEQEILLMQKRLFIKLIKLMTF